MRRNPSPNRRNRALIQRTLDYAAANPDVIDPTGCRSEGGMCLAALAADLAEGEWFDDPDGGCPDYLYAEPGDDPRHVVHLVWAHDRARRLLGTSEGFGDGTTVEDFRRLLATGRVS